MNFLTAKGWLREEERRALRNFATLAVPQNNGVIVNIGIEYGASVHCLHEGNPEAVIFALDLDIGKYEGEIYERVAFWQGDSGGQELHDRWVKEIAFPIDLLFIDGDHTYEGVKRDLWWTHWVKPNGYVLFHDCYDFEDPSIVHRVVPGVNEAVSEWYGAVRAWGPVTEEHAMQPSMFGNWTEDEPIGTMRIFKKVR